MRRWVFILCVGACQRANEAAHDPSVLIANAPDGDAIVATVDGRPIRASDVVAQAHAAGVDKQTALAALVDAEVLAGAAVARGLADDSDVVFARRAAEGRKLLAVDFEPTVTAAKLPDTELHRAYDLNGDYYNRGEVAEVRHVIALGSSKGPPEAREQAHAQIVALQARAQAATTDDAFAALAVEDPPPGQVQEKTERLSFPRTGVVEESFAAAAFALTKPGQVSGPVETSYGWHLIRLIAKLPPHHVSFEAARPELTDKTLTVWQQQQLSVYMQGLTERWGAVEHPERIAQEAAP